MRILAPTCLLAAIAVASPAVAQIFPGHSVATVTVTGVGGEMYDVDHKLATATPLLISPQLVAEVPNCVLMTDPINGFIGTNNAGLTSNIFSITIVGNTVTETLLNTTPTAGANCAQLALWGGRVYFCTQNAGLIGAIQSVPTTGGAVTLDLDLASLGAISLANALCEMNNKIYCATFNSGSNAATPCELFEFDPITGGGRLVMNLPQGGFAPNATPWNIGCVNMRPDPTNPGVLVIQGVYGEVMKVDPATATVVSQVWTGVHNAAGTGIASRTVNSFDWDPIAQDWVIGTRDGFIDHWVGAGQAQRTVAGVGSSATPTQNSIGGLAHMPDIAGSDATYGGDGCPGTGNWLPVNSSQGAPLAGNANFRFGLTSANGGDSAVLFIDLQNVVLAGMPLPIDLVVIGAPNCWIRTGNMIAIGLPTAGAGEGQGTASLPLAIPAILAGTTLYHQWIVLQTVPTNPAGIVVSNARRMFIQ